jgi:hypothetical protein
MADLLKKNAEFKFKSESVPKLAAALKKTGMSVENIQTVLQDPALAKQLIADLEDGKIDSKAIADYLNSIKDEKIVEIRGKFNAGDFAGAAAPGMELVNKMFSVQEQLIRTGVSKASSAMVANVKKLKAVNEEYQLLIQEISFNQIRPIEKAIEKAQRDLEVNIVRKIEDYQEQVNDLQRIIEIAFERPIAAINAENTILSNDMEIMNHAAEEINKRYDEQAEALSKVAEVNAQIVEQEKEQLDLADALSKGDIAAAARAVQSIRAAQSARNAENASKALEQSRKNKLDNLKGKESGLTRDQITERQYQNAQAVYELENKATTDVNGKLLTRLEILDQIQKKSDEIYNLEEKREAAQLAIRDKEDQIYKIKQEQIAPLEDTIEKNNVLIARDEYNIQKLVDGITVLGKTKDAWDGIQAKIDSSALAGEDFDRLMGSMLASTDQIEAGWAKIESTFAKYSSATAAAAGSAMDTMRKQLNEELATNEKIAKEKAEQAKAAQEAAQKEYEIKKAAYEAELKAIEELRKMGDGGLANARLAKLGAAPVAPVFGPTEAADNANVNYNDLSKNAAEDMYAAALKAGKGPVTSSAGGTYVAPSGTGGSSTNGSTTVPGPGGTSTTGTQTTTTTTTNSGTQTVTPTVVPGVKAGTAMSPEDRGVLATATDDRMNKLKQIASNKVVFALNQLKSKYGTNDKNSDTYKNLTGAKRTAFDIDYKNYETRQKEFDEWNKHPSGSGTSGAIDAGYSVAGLKARSELLKELPQWVQDAVAVIDRRQELRNKDLLPFLEIQKKFYAAKDELKIGSNWSFKEIENYKPFMDKYSDVFYKYKEMTANIKSRNEATDLARQNLLKAGYNLSNLGWAFESGQKNSGVGGPFHDSTPKGFMASQSYSYYSSGGSVASRFGQKGISLGTDTIPAMLTPGEFVMSRYAVKSHGIGKMQAINSGSSIGDSVYNYSVNVNVKSDSNPDEIARTVIAQIKSIDSQRIRGVRS